MSDFDKELDTSGLNCPLPIIKAKKEINTMESGQVLHVISTDPGAVMDGNMGGASASIGLAATTANGEEMRKDLKEDFSTAC